MSRRPTTAALLTGSGTLLNPATFGSTPTSRSGIARLAGLFIVVAACSQAWGAKPGSESPRQAGSEWKQDRRELIAEQLALSPTEARVFWPVFERYQAEMDRLVEERKRLIGEFGAMYDEMGPESAKRLLIERLDLEEQWVGLLKSYLPKFQRVLPAKKLARYYQIEMKMKTAVDCELAEQLPLIK